MLEEVIQKQKSSKTVSNMAHKSLKHFPKSITECNKYEKCLCGGRSVYAANAKEHLQIN